MTYVYANQTSTPFIPVARITSYEDAFVNPILVVKGLSVSSNYSIEKKLNDVGRFQFREPLTVKISSNSNGFLLESETGRFYVTGSTEEELMVEFKDNLDYVWKKFVEGNESNMNEGAKLYRTWLKNNLLEKGD